MKFFVTDPNGLLQLENEAIEQEEIDTTIEEQIEEQIEEEEIEKAIRSGSFNYDLSGGAR